MLGLANMSETWDPIRLSSSAMNGENRLLVTNEPVEFAK